MAQVIDLGLVVGNGFAIPDIVSIGERSILGGNVAFRRNDINIGHSDNVELIEDGETDMADTTSTHIKINERSYLRLLIDRDIEGLSGNYLGPEITIADYPVDLSETFIFGTENITRHLDYNTRSKSVSGGYHRDNIIEGIIEPGEYVLIGGTVYGSGSATSDRASAVLWVNKIGNQMNNDANDLPSASIGSGTLYG